MIDLLINIMPLLTYCYMELQELECLVDTPELDCTKKPTTLMNIPLYCCTRNLEKSRSAIQWVITITVLLRGFTLNILVFHVGVNSPPCWSGARKLFGQGEYILIY